MLKNFSLCEKHFGIEHFAQSYRDFKRVFFLFHYNPVIRFSFN